MPFALPWVDLQIIILSEVSQKENGKYHMISHMWNLKYDTNELSVKQTNRYREQTCGCQGEGRVGEGWIGSLGLAGANYYI